MSQKSELCRLEDQLAPASHREHAANIPVAMRDSQKLECSVKGKDGIRPRRRGNKISIGVESLRTAARWDGCIEASFQSDDSVLLHVVLDAVYGPGWRNTEVAGKVTCVKTGVRARMEPVSSFPT